MSFLLDTFTDADGTTLAAHTGEIGATWAGPNATVYIIQSNQLTFPASSVINYAYSSGVPGGPEYDINYTVTPSVAGARDKGPTGRQDTTANTGYGAITNGQAWKLQKAIAGVVTILGTYNDPRALPFTAAAQLQLRDAAKKLFVDGVERISNPDNEITGAGRVGFYGRGGSSVLTIAQIEASEPAAGSVFNATGQAALSLTSHSHSYTLFQGGGTALADLTGAGESKAAMHSTGNAYTDFETPGEQPGHYTTPGHTWFHHQYALYKLGITDQPPGPIPPTYTP
jgi:hypothetical protein